jgi:hypothetical protein
MPPWIWNLQRGGSGLCWQSSPWRWRQEQPGQSKFSKSSSAWSNDPHCAAIIESAYLYQRASFRSDLTISDTDNVPDEVE